MQFQEDVFIACNMKQITRRNARWWFLSVSEPRYLEPTVY